MSSSPSGPLLLHVTAAACSLLPDNCAETCYNSTCPCIRIDMLIHLISIALFSSWPQYAIIFFHCARHNPEVTFTLVTNLDDHHPSWREKFGDLEKPRNVHFASYTFDEVVSKIHEDNLGLGVNLTVKSPYKLIDYKPLYGVLFQKELMGCTHWGWFDLDIFVGNIKAVYECGYDGEDIISYDHVLVHGPLMVIRNAPVVNTFYKNMEPLLKTAFLHARTILFDENYFPRLIVSNNSVTVKKLKKQNCEIRDIWMWYRGNIQSRHGPCVIYHFGGGPRRASAMHKELAWARAQTYFSGQYYKNDEYGYGEIRKRNSAISFIFTFIDKKFKIVPSANSTNMSIKVPVSQYYNVLSDIAVKFHAEGNQCNKSLVSLNPK